MKSVDEKILSFIRKLIASIDGNPNRVVFIDTYARAILSVAIIVASFVFFVSTSGGAKHATYGASHSSPGLSIVRNAHATPSASGSARGSTASGATQTTPIIQSPQVITAKPLGLALGNTLPALTSSQLNTELNGIATLGVSWIRIDIPWPDIQPQNATTYNWTSMDAVVAAATARHIKIMAILDYTPAWARAAGCNSEMCAPASDSQFAAFASAVVQRYAPDGLQTWEIWNEPNLEGSWQPSPNAQSYTSLLKATYAAIKKVQPGSTVISGGLGPLDGESSSIDQLTFLGQMYADGAEPYLDAVGYHPYSYPAPPSYVISWNSWSTMSDLPTSVRSIMTANGDANKQIWVTEYGAPTDGPGAISTSADPNYTAGPDHVDEALQSEMLSQALGVDQSSSWMGGFFWYSYQDLGTDTSTNENFFGLLTSTGSQKPAYSVMQSAASNPLL